MKSPSRRGFSIIESVLSVVIVGVLGVASVGAFGSIARTRYAQAESRLGTLLAQQLMSEILGEAFAAPGAPAAFGPKSGQTRTTFDAVDGYDGYTASPPASSSGAAVGGYDGWTEKVKVAYVTPAAPMTTTASVTALKRVTVTVVSPSGRTYELVGWRSKFGPYELTPPAVTTYVTSVAVTVQGPSPTKAVQSGAHPLNIVSSQ